MRIIFLLSSLMLPLFLFGQVVNTEKLRLNVKEKPFVGEVNLNFRLTRNKAGQTLGLGANSRFEYVKNKSRWLLVGGYNLTQFNNVDEPGSVPKNFANNSFGHLRYNYNFNDWLTWEAFTQAQYDEIQQIDIRWLAGTGPRLRIVDTDTVQLFFGLLYMYEYEDARDELVDPERTLNIISNDHRLSSYLSGGFSLTDYFSINHVTYFQPKLSNPEDFRISTETSFSVKVTETLSFNTYFQLVYDTRPPIPVPRTMYMLSNGLSVKL